MATSGEMALEKDPALLESLATAFLQALYQFLRLTETHDEKNKVFDTITTDLFRTYSSFMAGADQRNLELTFRGEQIFINRLRLRPRPRQFHVYRFILKFMRIRRIGAVEIKNMGEPDQMRRFLSLLSKSIHLSREQIEPAVQLMDSLRELGMSELYEVSPLKKTFTGSGSGGGESSSAGGLVDVELASAAIYDSLKEFLVIVLENLDKAERFELRPFKELIHDLMELADEDVMQALRLLSVKRYENPLAHRGVNAAFMMLAWGNSLRLPKGIVQELVELALIHSLALKFVDDKIDRPSDLQMKEIYGVVHQMRSIIPLTTLQVLAFGEWLHPFGENGIYSVHGTQCYQHFFSRMIRIIAFFEQMTTYDKGRRVFMPDEALAELLKSGQNCDPTLVKVFINWLGVYPLGSLVELNTGEVAQIFAGASDPLKFQRPIVLILKSADGEILARPQIFDLSEMNERLGVYRKSIRRSTSFEAAGLNPQKLRSSPVAF